MQYLKISKNFRKNIFYFTLSHKTHSIINHRFTVKLIFSWLTFSGIQNFMSSQKLYPFVYQCTNMRVSTRAISPLEYSQLKIQLCLLIPLTKARWEQICFYSGFVTRKMPLGTCPIKWCTNNRDKKNQYCHWSHWKNIRQNYKIHLLTKGQECH